MYWIGPFPGFGSRLEWLHDNAIHRARGDAQLAAGTLRGNNGMHLFSRTEDRIYWAGLDAERTADTGILDDHRDSRFRLGFMLCI